jgi:hypothetical protein
LSAATSKSTGANLNFVTAIVDSELEAAAAQLLYSHGNNIIFRALTITSLDLFLSENQSNYQVIYSTDFASDKLLNDLAANFPKIKFNKVSRNFDAATLLSNLSQNSRQPMVRQDIRHQNLISVMGSFGSPGISSVTNQIAARFTDATILHPLSNNHRPQISSNNKLLEARESNINTLISPSEKYFLDAGATTALTTTISDRRFSGQLLNWALNSSAKLIYVIKPDENGIASLSNFLIDYQNLITPPSLICVLNQQRFTAKARLINTQFQSLTAKLINFQIPYDFSSAAKYPSGKQWWMTTFTKQFDLIAKSLA